MNFLKNSGTWGKKKIRNIVNGKTEWGLSNRIAPIWEGNIYAETWRMNN